MNPFDYSLCRQTLTLYGMRNGQQIRKEIRSCYFAPVNLLRTDLTGKSRLKKFLLIIPGQLDVQPGDRIYDGIGPETVEWNSFLPDLSPRVYEIGNVKPCLWEGEICHIQAEQ